VSRDHKLSMRKQCELLHLSRSRLCYQPVGENAENLRFMEIINWACPVFVPLQVLVYATFRSKATGLFQPNAEWRRRGL
jgi:hypothetical protein